MINNYIILLKFLLISQTCSVSYYITAEHMVYLYDIGILGKQVYLELLLRCEEWQHVIEMIYLLATEYKLVILEQIVAMLVHIDLQC